MSVKLHRYILSLFPVKKGKIVFNNFNGKGFGCNPKYIAQKILEKNKDQLDLVWLVKSDLEAKSLPPGIRPIRISSLLAKYEVSTANVIFSNVRMGTFFSKGLRKKDNQLYVQTWHGGFGIKKIEADAENLPQSYIEMAKIDSQSIDILLSSSRWQTKHFKRCFYYDGLIEEVGTPRTDLFYFENREAISREVKIQLGIAFDEKVVLYVPTFRDGGNELYDLDFDCLVSKLSERFQGKWRAVVRYHPNARPKSKVDERIVDATNYPDIQELLLASDVLVTDYSSACFDFALTKRPVFLYAPDWREYSKERGMEVSLSATPFPVAESNKQLAQTVVDFDSKQYEANLDQFFRTHQFVQFGKASDFCAEVALSYIAKFAK